MNDLEDNITQIKQAQSLWANGIIEIGKMQRDYLDTNKKDEKSRIRKKIEAYTDTFLDLQYVFGNGINEILFKPTKAYEHPFRVNKKGTTSYFIGKDSAFNEDSGFALTPWKNVQFHYDKDNFLYKKEKDGILVMGHYTFEDYDGEKVKVEYSFGYQEIDEKLKIRLHHSSFPYKPFNDLKFSLEINGSTHEAARYIGWRPVKCVLHMNTAGRSVVQGGTVTIKSKGTETGTGKIVFLDHADSTVQKEELTISKIPGNKVTFYVAGKFGHPSTDCTDVSIVMNIKLQVGKEERPNDEKLKLEIPLMVRVRKNANQLQPKEIKELLAAFVELTKKSAKNNYKGDKSAKNKCKGGKSPKNKYKGDFSHVPGNLFDELVLLHTMDAADEIHGRTSFYPWHRIFLLHLERELQEINPTITLPYWKYDEKAPNVFTQDFIGETKKSKSSKFVNIRETLLPEFSEANPLKNWKTIWHPMTRAYYDENPAEKGHSQIIPDYCLLKKSPANFKDWSYTYGEGKSHNRAHVVFSGRVVDVGKDPADPLFFLLHTNVDRLWAKWQKEHGRFDAENIATYPFQGKKETREEYEPGYKNLQLGNYLDDNLWPWDWDNDFPKPTRKWNKNDYAEEDGHVPFINLKLPQSDFFYSPLKPTVKDTIDFRGEENMDNNLGFDYEDIPYFQSDLVEPVVHICGEIFSSALTEIVFDKNEEEETRLKMLKGSLLFNESDNEKIIEIINDRTDSLQVRIAALNIINEHDGEFIDACLNIIDINSKEDEDIILEAIQLLKLSKRASRYYHSRKATFFNHLRGYLRSTKNKVKSAAIELLASHGDNTVQDYLLEQLDVEKNEPAELQTADALFFLSFDPKPAHEDLFLKQLAEGKDDEIKVAAAKGLAEIPTAKEKLKETLFDNQVAIKVRAACAESLHQIDFQSMNVEAVELVKGLAKKEDVSPLRNVLLNMINFTGDIEALKTDEKFIEAISVGKRLETSSYPNESVGHQSSNPFEELSSQILAKINH